MTITNRHKKHSRILEAKFGRLLRLFSLDIDATNIAKISRLNRNTVNLYLRLLRERIVKLCEKTSPFSGIIEVDESYFGAKRVKGNGGQGASGKTPVFGILQRGGQVYTEIVPDCALKTLQGTIRGKVDPDSVIHSDYWRGYNGLVDMGYKKHYRIKHGVNEFVKCKNHIHGIEPFWSFAKRRLEKFHGISKKLFNSHLKECKFCFNNRNKNIYQIMLNELRKSPLS